MKPLIIPTYDDDSVGETNVMSDLQLMKLVYILSSIS